MIRLGLLFILALSLLRCGGGSTREFRLLKRPTDMVVSQIDLEFDGRISRLIYVLSADSGTVSVLDQRNEDFVDTDSGDDFKDSPVIVGGRPVAIALDDRGDVPRLFVADESTNQLFAFDAVPPVNPEKKRIRHDPLSLGGSVVTRASRPIFRDLGRNSTPAFSEIEVDSDATPQSWDLKYQGEGKGYKAIGSSIGERDERVFEDENSSLDSGSLRFKIRSGGELTTTDDQFRFGINRLRPLDLPGKPTDMEVQGDRLYVSLTDPGALLVIDLDSRAIESTISLGGGAARPSFLVTSGGFAFVNDLDSSSIYRVNLGTQAVSAFNVGNTIEALGLDPEDSSRIFLFPRGLRELHVFDPSTQTTTDQVVLNSFGLGFEAYTFEEKRRALIPTVAGDVEVLNLSNLNRVDTRDNRPDSETESDYRDDEFFDAGAKSSPRLISVNTKDRQTRNERWQVVYEGVLPGAGDLQGNVSGDVITFTGANLEELYVQPGDLVNLKGEEAEVAEVLSDTSLRLTAASDAQGDLNLKIRVQESYVVTGSLSGTQRKRVFENEAYESDEEDIALTIRSSRSEPTTRGDYFTFLTMDGTDPIYTGGKRMSRSAHVFTRPGETVPTAYVIHEVSDSVSSLDLDSLRERKVIR